MNKKFMVVALLAALSTVGYAYDSVGGNVENLNDTNHGTWNQTTINKINSNVNSIVSKTDENFGKVQGQLNQKVNKDEVYTKTEVNNTFATKGELKDEVTKIEIENSIQNGRLDEAEKKLENKADYSDLAAVEADKNAIKEDLDKTKAEIDKNKKEQGNVDATQNNRLDKVETGKVDKGEYIKDKATISEEIGKVDQKAEEAHNRIDKVVEVNKNQTADINKNKEDIKDLSTKLDNEVIRQDYKNKVQDGRLDKVENKNKDQDAAIKENKNAIEKETADRIAADEKLAAQMDKFQGQMDKYEGRLSGLEKKVAHLDDKMNKGLSLMAAMNAVDFQNVQTGEMAIGAGVGHYGNAQSVALGVAYSPVEDLTVNAKYSVTAGDVDSFALGAGATYKFKVGR